MTEKSSPRVTLLDVAGLAGVGSATVDRVINDRGNVSADIRKRVLDAARTLGLKRILPSAHHRIVRLNVILARPELPLIQRMGFEFRRLAQRMQHSLTIHRTLLEDEDPATIVTALYRGAYDAVIVYAQDHPLIRAAIAELAAQGRPVVTMISDLPGSERLAYAGTDHYKAGRSAGYFMGLMARHGSVVVLCNHLGFQSHAARLDGLQDQLAQDSDLVVAEVVEGGDDPIRSEVRLKEAFRRHSDAVAVYNVGAGNRGVVAAIKADILPNRPIFIGHELTQFTHASLRQGLMTLTIDQSPELQAQFALEVLLNHFGFENVTDLAPPYVSTVPIVLYGPQNLPDALPG